MNKVCIYVYLFIYLSYKIDELSGVKEGFEGWETDQYKVTVFVTRKSWYGVGAYYSLLYLNSEHTAQFNHLLGLNKQGWVLLSASQQSEKTPKQTHEPMDTNYGHKHSRCLIPLFSLSSGPHWLIFSRWLRRLFCDGYRLIWSIFRIDADL